MTQGSLKIVNCVMTLSPKGKSNRILDEETWKEEGIVTFQSVSELCMRNEGDSIHFMSFHRFDNVGVE
jgi:hypothetical protein